MYVCIYVYRESGLCLFGECWQQCVTIKTLCHIPISAATGVEIAIHYYPI